MKKVFVIIIMLILVSGCSATNKKEPPKKTNENNISEKEVSLINNQAYVPQHDCKYQYMINFKMSCSIVHKRYPVSSSNERRITPSTKDTVVSIMW